MKLLFSTEYTSNHPTSFLFLILIFFSILNYTLLAQWIEQESNVHTRLTDVFFADSLYGWAAGDSGIIISTSNGGENWNKICTLPDSFEIKKVQFISKDIGFAGGNIVIKFPNYEAHKAFLIRTLDGGYSWERFDSSFDSGFSFGNFHFFNRDTGWVSINNIGQESLNDREGILLKTSNGGSSWSLLKEESFLLCNAFIFNNDGYGFSFWSTFFDNFEPTDVYSTSDYGVTWNLEGTIEEDLIKKAIYTSEGFLWAIGFKTSLSINGGKDWKSWDRFVSIGGEKRFIPTDIKVMDSYNTFLLGDAMTSASDIEGRLLKTNDLGENWVMDLQRLNSSFAAIFVIKENKAWIVGSNGLILHNSILTEVESAEEKLLHPFYFDQNYPNPFNSQTNIRYQVPRTENATLKVYDILGREIATLVNKSKKPGYYTATFDASDLASGMYIYRLQINDFVSSKKMMLMK